MQKCLYLLLITLLIGCTSNYKNCDANEHRVLPQLYLSLSPIAWDSICFNQRYKATAHAIMLDMNSDTIFNDDIKYVKGRGNSSWGQQKDKPLTIKLQNSTKLLNLKKGKSFCLLSSDKSMIRNAIAFDLAQRIGLQAPEYSYVSLFVNNEYIGRYMITNKISVGKRGVNIIDLDIENQLVNFKKLKEYPSYEVGCTTNQIDNTLNEYIKGSCKFSLLDDSPIDITGGYLLNVGHNGYYKSKSGFVSSFGNYVRLESPKYASENELNYIADYYNQIEALIMDLQKDQDLQELSQYINIESFARYYLLQEILLNVDCGQNSFYMYKDANDIMYAGPIWDFDLSLNNYPAVGTYFLPNEIWMHKNDTMSKYLPYLTCNWFQHLCRNVFFEEIVADIYIREVEPSIYQYLADEVIDSIITIIRKDAQNEKFNSCDRTSYTYQESTNMVMNFLKNRLKFLHWYYTTPRESMVCITDTTLTPEMSEYRRFYIPKGNTFTPPMPIFVGGKYIQTPIPMWYYAGTDRVFNGREKLYKDCAIEIHWRDPSWIEVQCRRMAKLWHKIF